jgi:nucleotide-binding universal stress UspA family protein
MTIADLLVYVDNSESCENTIIAAQNLAEENDAHLTGLYVTRPPYIPVYSGIDSAVSAEAIVAMEASIKEQTKIAREKFEKLTNAWQSKVRWLEVEGETAPVINENAHNYDLVVIGQANPKANNKPKAHVVEHVALACGRPLLIVPYKYEKSEFGKRILVAWNGSRESTRATHDALPFLTKAESVDIAAVNPSKDIDIPCSDIAEHLSRHNVVIETESAYAYRQDVGKQILTLATTYGADMLVMGAYGHSRLTSLILGGATRHILEEMTIPVLMSH